MYIKIFDSHRNKFPYSMVDLQNDNPDTSFPEPKSEELLANFGVYKVVGVPVPVLDNKTHKHSQDVQNINGTWTQVWTVQKLPEVEAAANIRAHRDGLLSDCDWTQVVDAPVDKAVWATYRQALRDISKQPGFPWNVVWPTTP
jgi:hypothetical protein